MSEVAPATPEQKPGKLETVAELKEDLQITPELAAHAKQEQSEQLKAAEQAVAEQAPVSNAMERHLKAAEDATAAPQTGFVDKALKHITLRRELKHIQRTLPAPSRALSKLVHQPVVRLMSETAGKTVSRPSGLLGGGIVAFLGTTSYLVLAKHLGFTYNYLLFLLLFVAGFAVGLVLELVVRSFSHKAQS